MALGLPLPKKVYGHGWLLQEGGKMSKSKGNVLYADDLVELFGRDAVRYYVLTAMPQGSDGIISRESIVEKVNADLANVLGNLVNRTVAMINKYFGGKISDKGVAESVDDDLKQVATSVAEKVYKDMDDCCVSDALEDIFSLFRRANKYIDETAPWILAKDEAKQDRLATVLYNLTESILIGLSLLYPFMPETAEKGAANFGLKLRAFDTLNTFASFKETTVKETPEILFARLDPKVIEEKAEQMQPAQPQEKAQNSQKKEGKPMIDIEDFEKVQLKVAKVLACEKVEKSNKLLKLTLKLGDETRTVVSGIAKHYTPEDLIGKKLVIVANLKPAKLCGIESQGMIVCAENTEGKIAFLSPEKDIEDGSDIF